MHTAAKLIIPPDAVGNMTVEMTLNLTVNEAAQLSRDLKAANAVPGESARSVKSFSIYWLTETLDTLRQNAEAAISGFKFEAEAPREAAKEAEAAQNYVPVNPLDDLGAHDA